MSPTVRFHQGAVLENSLDLTEHFIPKPANKEFSQVGQFFAGKVGEQWQAFDVTCDHNGGQLRLNADSQSATCPIHKWTLNLQTGLYENGCKKSALAVEELPTSLAIRSRVARFPHVDRSKLTTCPVELFFNAHASVSLMCGQFSLITDPWLVGSCFATGWWHAAPPSTEALERLRNASLIYISHNHPDHLHLPTLKQFVAPDTTFLVPNFASGSVEKLLRREGFSNLIVTNFLHELIVETGVGQLKLIVVKSGDERDDSSLLVMTNNHSVFFGVDTNMPNRWALPDVNVLFTSFAGGASGFPARIDNFDIDAKQPIVATNRRNLLNNHVTKLIKSTRPAYVVPYAGYFREMFRDMDVAKLNQKNTVEDCCHFISERFPGVIAVNPLKMNEIKLTDGKAEFRYSQGIPAHIVDESYVAEEIQKFSTHMPLVDAEYLDRLGQAFMGSRFFEKLNIAIIPTDDSFEPCSDWFLTLDFSENSRGYQVCDLDECDIHEIPGIFRNKNNVEVLRIRQDSMRGVFGRGLPLEDLSIGFQVRMYRVPNVYNFNFWDHFTNHENLQLA